jgi:hypothetical protein
MSDEQVTEEITRLEDEIEALADNLERCRKIGLVSKLVMWGGGAWLLAAVLGLVTVYPAALIGALAAAIGGVVLSGSNAATATQAMEAMKRAEARRAELISAMPLRLVGE